MTDLTTKVIFRTNVVGDIEYKHEVQGSRVGIPALSYEGILETLNFRWKGLVTEDKRKIQIWEQVDE